MASYKNSGYQYETSPRKIAPEYSPRKEQKVNKTKKTNTANKPKTKPKLKPHAKTILYVFAGFTLLFALSYQNSLINESFDKKEDLKQELATIEKENEQAKVNIQNSLNLANVEKSAKDMLGMKKLDTSQKIYVSLPKKDYVEPAIEKVVIETEETWWQKILDSIIDFVN
jgi:hypothetical protein